MVESTQIRWFSRRSGGGGWSGRALAHRRPRVSKLRLKGLSDYHSNEPAVEAAILGPCGLKKGYSHNMFTQKRRAEKTALSLTERTKGDPPDERATDEVEIIFYSNSG